MSHLKVIAASILFILSPLLAGPQSQPAVRSSPQQKGMMMNSLNS